MVGGTHSSENAALDAERSQQDGSLRTLVLSVEDQVCLILVYIFIQSCKGAQMVLLALMYIPVMQP